VRVVVLAVAFRPTSQRMGQGSTSWPKYNGRVPTEASAGSDPRNALARSLDWTERPSYPPLYREPRRTVGGSRHATTPTYTRPDAADSTDQQAEAPDDPESRGGETMTAAYIYARKSTEQYGDEEQKPSRA